MRCSILRSERPFQYFIIVPALLGNGQSSSPSNHTANPFPQITFYDNVRAQYRLVEHLGIRRLFAVVGWSMGAGQTFQWITQYPDFVDLAVPFCGSARTSLHNQVFLEGVKSALLAAKKIPSAGSKKGGVAVEGTEARTWTDEEKSIGLKAFGRGYAGWSANRLLYSIPGSWSRILCTDSFHRPGDSARLSTAKSSMKSISAPRTSRIS